MILEKPTDTAEMKAMIELFKIAQSNDTFESLEVQGTSLEEVTVLKDAFEEVIVHGSQA